MYEKMYHILLNAITEAMEKLEWQDHEGALTLLETACQDAGEVYVMQAPEPSQDTAPLIRCPLWGLQSGSPDLQQKLAQLMAAGRETEDVCISE